FLLLLRANLQQAGLPGLGVKGIAAVTVPFCAQLGVVRQVGRKLTQLVERRIARDSGRFKRHSVLPSLGMDVFDVGLARVPRATRGCDKPGGRTDRTSRRGHGWGRRRSRHSRASAGPWSRNSAARYRTARW